MVNKEDIEDILDELANKGVYGSAVIDRDGTPIVSDLPIKVNESTYSIMCATILGAAKTANSELDRKPLEKITIDSNDRKIIIVVAGRKMFLSAIVDSVEDIEKTESIIFEAAEKIREIK